jgi:hypothetical protein
VLRSYGYDRMRGGRARLEGTADFRPQGAPFEGQITVEDTMFSQVPWLVKLVSFASVKGARRAWGRSRPSSSTASSRRSRAVRRARSRSRTWSRAVPSSGSRSTARSNRASDALDLRGTVIPSYYFLNEGADRIPVIGNIIGSRPPGASGGDVQRHRDARGAGRDGQPLSSLAPGVMREWLRRLGL